MFTYVYTTIFQIDSLFSNTAVLIVVFEISIVLDFIFYVGFDIEFEALNWWFDNIYNSIFYVIKPNDFVKQFLLGFNYNQSAIAISLDSSFVIIMIIILSAHKFFLWIRLIYFLILFFRWLFILIENSLSDGIAIVFYMLVVMFGYFLLIPYATEFMSKQLSFMQQSGVFILYVYFLFILYISIYSFEYSLHITGCWESSLVYRSVIFIFVLNIFFIIFSFFFFYYYCNPFFICLNVVINSLFIFIVFNNVDYFLY